MSKILVSSHLFSNQDALGSMFANEVFQDAIQLGESYSMQSDWNERSLISSDGDTAAILQHISGHSVEVQVDIGRTRTTRAAIEGNSRKAGMDQCCRCLRSSLSYLDADQ